MSYSSKNISCIGFFHNYANIDVNKTSESKECDYWYFLIKDLSVNQISAMSVMMY